VGRVGFGMKALQQELLSTAQADAVSQTPIFSRDTPTQSHISPSVLVHEDSRGSNLAVRRSALDRMKALQQELLLKALRALRTLQQEDAPTLRRSNKSFSSRPTR